MNLMYIVIPVTVVLGIVILHGLIKFLARYFLHILLIALFVACVYAAFLYMVG